MKYFVITKKDSQLFPIGHHAAWFDAATTASTQFGLANLLVVLDEYAVKDMIQVVLLYRVSAIVRFAYAPQLQRLYAVRSGNMDDAPREYTVVLDTEVVKAWPERYDR